ncbi:MAG TPA: DUF58 domain-containing protein [Candidatus Babeliales bacterium]|nr:DUF58 domain-containing protein [Candidatus Babeliales bacterium]
MVEKKKLISPEIAHKIKQLEIFTRRLLNGSLVGDSRSAIKGTGFEFDQIREYSFGDDIRFIDWKASARSNKLLVKQYIEERSRTIFLAVDVSQSSIFGSSVTNKHTRITELASVLALVAHHGKDHVGLLLFSDNIEEYIPPASSLHHVHRVVECILGFAPKKSTTDTSKALQHLLSVKKSDAIVFLISDFIDDELDTYLAQAACKYDLIAVRCLDVNEKIMPPVGFITVEDMETGEFVELDLRNNSSGDVKKFLATRIDEQNMLFKRRGIDFFEVSSEKHDYLSDMVKFFRRRMMY